MAAAGGTGGPSGSRPAEAGNERYRGSSLGDRTVITRDGTVHLALDRAEAAVLDLVDGTRSRAEILDRPPEKERERIRPVT